MQAFTEKLEECMDYVDSYKIDNIGMQYLINSFVICKFQTFHKDYLKSNGIDMSQLELVWSELPTRVFIQKIHDVIASTWDQNGFISSRVGLANIIFKTVVLGVETVELISEGAGLPLMRNYDSAYLQNKVL